MLVERAVAHGAELIDAIWLSISSLGSQFRLEVDRRPPLEADFVIDATGRRGRVAQAMGARRVLFDRQVTAVLFFDTAPNFRSDRTWIEAAEHGWWYAARIPRGAVAAFSTDSDIARQLKLRDGTALSRQLNSTRQLRNLLRDAHPTHAPRLVPSSSSMLDDFAGEGWAAVGDAAISSDPLSGQGLLNALRHAFLATHLVSDYLGGKQDVHRVYQTHLLQQAEDYFAARAEVYATEHRFDDSPFWRRRRSQITLAPDRPVSMGDPVAARQVRWLLPAKDMARLATCAVGGGTASEVIASARASGVQASDRRLVLALQHLVAAKIVR